MADFNYELNNWEEKIKAKLKLVEWLRTLQPQDFAILLRRLVQNALTAFSHDQERYDETLRLIQEDFECINDLDWHLKREVYDQLVAWLQNADVVISFLKDKDYPEGRFYVNHNGIHSGNTLIEAVYAARKDWEK